ncbi:MAG: helix-turn-helix transcriptional regulator [Hamadaea sp.]|nr:helix-turn-helix transcriptional regulator [Hamadaea sp.]
MRYFTLSDAEASARTEILDEAARACSVSFRARPADRDRPIAFQHLDRYFAGVNVTQTILDNFQGYRSPEIARKDPTPRLILTVTSGPYRIEQNGRVNCEQTGSMVASWSRDAWRHQGDEPVRARAITVTMEELGLPYPFLRDVMVRNIGVSPLGPLVGRYLADLANLPPMSPEQAATLASPTIDLLRALLTTAAGDEFRSRGPLGDSLGMRIMMHLRTHVTDPELSAGKLAAHFGISRRQVYAVLARMGVTLGEWIRTERLQRAARDLANPANALLPVATIARMCGFADHSSFSRVFKQRYGCTPSEWRVADAYLTARQEQLSLPLIAEIASETRG